MLLHFLAYLARGALINWWHTLVPAVVRGGRRG